MIEPEPTVPAVDPVPAEPAVPATDAAVTDAAVTDPTSTDDSVVAFRLRSLIGLTIGFVAPRANLAVSGVLLTLLVTSRASGALAITLALTANRLVGWIAYPVLGRASDRTRVPAGRRVPYLAAGLLLMGVCTFGYTLVGGYWPLVGLIAVVKTASVMFGLNNVAAVPETFGKSRTLKALVSIAVFGTLLSLIIKFTVIATWRTSNPATWNLPFRLAGAVMIVASILVVLLVREAPAVRQLVDHDRSTAGRRWRDELADIAAGPNAKVLLAGVFLFWSGFSATGYLAVVYFQKVQHAGASIQTIAGWITGIPALLVGLPIGILISRTFSRKAVAVVTPIVGSLLLVVQFFSTHFWQSVALAIAGAPLATAFAVSLAPMFLQLLPRSGGMGELLGKLIAPFSAFAVLCSVLAAWLVDLTGEYRMIWVLPAVAYLLLGLVMLALWIPPGHERVPPLGEMIERTSDAVLAQVMTRNPDRSLLGGEVTAADADATSWFVTARTAFGDPYASGPPGRPDDDPEPPAAPPGP